MTKDKIIYDIYNLLRPQATDDESLSTRQISQQIDNVRGLLMRQEYNKKKYVSPDAIQSLGCVKFIQVDSSECCTETGCTILRTECTIPDPLQVNNDILITRVGPIKLSSKPFPLINYHRVPYALTNRFTKHKPKAFRHNGYIYLIGGNQLLTEGNIQGVWEDPAEVANFLACAGGCCYDEATSKYPIPLHMIEPLKKMVMQNYASYFNMPVDEAGNSADDKPGDIH